MNAGAKESHKKPVQPIDVIDHTLSEAAQAAVLLLDYAAEQGSDIEEKFLDEKLISTIINTKHTMATRALEEEEEKKFWAAYRKLCMVTAPVTRESLEATTAKTVTTRFGEKKVSEASNVVRSYQVITIISFIILLFFQVYWVFLSTLVNDTRKINLELIKIETAGYMAKLDKPPQQPLAQKNTDKSLIDKVATQTEKKPANPQVRQYRYQDDPNYQETLRQWYANLGLLQKTDMLKLVFATQKIEAGYHTPYTHKDDIQVARDQFSNALLTQTGTISLNILSSYILPILYGLVGACAYILRTISKRIKTRTFTKASKIGFRLRMVLGALAGFSIAWFVGDKGSVTVVSNVAPLALAFIAGYSVELVFSMMDTLVEAFTRQRPAKPPKP